MGERAHDFLEHWKSEHVENVPDTHRMREAVRLAARCRRDATLAGIPAHELRAAAQYDMIRNMLAALVAAASQTRKHRSFLPRLLAHLRIGGRLTVAQCRQTTPKKAFEEGHKQGVCPDVRSGPA